MYLIFTPHTGNPHIWACKAERANMRCLTFLFQFHFGQRKASRAIFFGSEKGKGLSQASWESHTCQIKDTCHSITPNKNRRAEVSKIESVVPPLILFCDNEVQVAVKIDRRAVANLTQEEGTNLRWSDLGRDGRSWLTHYVTRTQLRKWLKGKWLNPRKVTLAKRCVIY